MTLDDATTERYSAFFIEEEGILSSLRGRQEVLETQGSSAPSLPIGARTMGILMRPEAEWTRSG